VAFCIDSYNFSGAEGSNTIPQEVPRRVSSQRKAVKKQITATVATDIDERGLSIPHSKTNSDRRRYGRQAALFAEPIGLIYRKIRNFGDNHRNLSLYTLVG
jgi:hypothetical protein